MIVETNFFQDSEQESIVFHGSRVEVEYPEVRKSKFTKDFSWGFYCTNMLTQACRWADRFNSSGIISIYEFKPNSSLKWLKFEDTTEAWLDFVVSCRSGKTHNFDIVEGPMADDKIFNYIQQFIDGHISRAAFWELIKFQHPTHQISFHTLSALQTLTFLEGLNSKDCVAKYNGGVLSEL